jgi:hypothetical protein
MSDVSSEYKMRIAFKLKSPENVKTRPLVKYSSVFNKWRVYTPCGTGYQGYGIYDTLQDAIKAAYQWVDRMKDPYYPEQGSIWRRVFIDAEPINVEKECDEISRKCREAFLAW